MPQYPSSTHGQEAFAFIEELDRLPTADDVMNAMQRALAPFGFENFIVAGIDPKRRFDEQVLANRWPSEFFTQYTRENYLPLDPIARLCRRWTMPFVWSKASYAHEQDPRALEVMRVAAQFRIKRGFVVPIHGLNGYEAAVSMSGVDLEIPPTSKPAIHLMALYAFDRMRCLIGAVSKNIPSLTQREREVLTWAAQGKSALEIAEILKITKRTVDEHTQITVRKLGAKNRTHAVAIALRERIIDI